MKTTNKNFEAKYNEIKKAFHSQADVTINVTGKKVKGWVEHFSEEEYGVGFNVVHKAVNWGGQLYTKTYCFLRHDGMAMYDIEF